MEHIRISPVPDILTKVDIGGGMCKVEFDSDILNGLLRRTGEKVPKALQNKDFLKKIGQLTVLASLDLVPFKNEYRLRDKYTNKAGKLVKDKGPYTLVDASNDPIERVLSVARKGRGTNQDKAAVKETIGYRPVGSKKRRYVPYVPENEYFRGDPNLISLNLLQRDIAYNSGKYKKTIFKKIPGQWVSPQIRKNKEGRWTLPASYWRKGTYRKLYDVADREPHLKNSYKIFTGGGKVSIRYSVSKPPNAHYVDKGGENYADRQYWAQDAKWNRFTKGTTSRWLEVGIGMAVDENIKIPKVSYGVQNYKALVKYLQKQVFDTMER